MIRVQEHIVDGEPVRWLEDGDGPPVVLVHGILTSPPYASNAS